jgi:hypothetical protein
MLFLVNFGTDAESLDILLGSSTALIEFGASPPRQTFIRLPRRFESVAELPASSTAVFKK